MACSKLQMSELSSLDPENYEKFFRTIQWIPNRKLDKKSQKKIGKKERLRRIKAAGSVGVCIAPVLLRNASHFAVFATVRKSILTRSAQLRLIDSETPDNSDNEEPSCSHHQSLATVPRITGIGLRMVFALISEARFADVKFCQQSLKALLDILQGHTPEDMSQEPSEMINILHRTLIEIVSGITPTGIDEVPNTNIGLSCACLVALTVSRGESELMLNAIAAMIMNTTAMTEQYIKIPKNLTILQRSVQSVILGESSRNQWINFGVPHQSLAYGFPVDLPCMMTTGPGELIVRSLASDGCYLYVYSSKGLIKIGTGYGSSLKQHIYKFKYDFFQGDRHGWLGYCKDKLYVRIGRKKPEVYEVNKETLEVMKILRLDPGQSDSPEQKCAVFTDGNQLGLVLLANYAKIVVKMYDVTNIPEHNECSPIELKAREEWNVHLLRRRTMALGRPPFDDGFSRRAGDNDTPVLMQLDDNDLDPLHGICAGQDFGLLTTKTGKVYYTGKGTSLGYKMASPHIGRWTLMKETLFNRNEPNVKKCQVTQTAVGHEGVHAILVLDNGSVLFTGIARRGEDGDIGKHRRNPKPTRPKKITRVEGHHIVYAACNYGSTALVTRDGLLFMFGKDTQHCDSTGLVTGLKHEKVIQVALGKAHAVALTNFGQVYTFGINNKSQCGREFGYGKEKYQPRRKEKEEVRVCVDGHSFHTDYCRVCTLCRQCTGFGNKCCCVAIAERVPGEYCRKCCCSKGESSCTACGICRKCASVTKISQPRQSDVADEHLEGMPAEPPPEKEESKSVAHEMSIAGPSSEVDKGERDTSVKVNSLPPARIAVPGGHRIVAIACGLHHTVLLSDNGEVLTFGSNQMGQLGAGDVAPHHRIVLVRLPRACSVAAGSNHTAILTRDGELYTFGYHQKGSLGRQQPEEPVRQERAPTWYATPGRVTRFGPRDAAKAVWVSASGDQTFVQLCQSVIKTDTIFSSTITANGNNIVILPNRPEHAFKCITINKIDSSCNAWTGPEQVDFVNSLACLDPLYNVLWCYQPQNKAIRCYNILAFDANKLQRCYNDPDITTENEKQFPNYGMMKRLEDFKDLKTFDQCRTTDEKPPNNMSLANISVLNEELAIPMVEDCYVTRMHAALHLLGCLDSLAFAHDNKLKMPEYKPDNSGGMTKSLAMLEDFSVVNRFPNHGGGWGYSDNSIEAIRFMCDRNILLGGYGLYGGRGANRAKIRLYDIGYGGGELEVEGQLLAESDDTVFQCAPRERYPILFDTPVPVAANRWYVAWAHINGSSSDCGSSGQSVVIKEDATFYFKTSEMSTNGTDVNAGQIGCLLYIVINSEELALRRSLKNEPIVILSKNMSRKVTVGCFKTIMKLMEWSWRTFRGLVDATNGLVPINYQKLSAMKQQKRLVYVIRSCLRLIRSYINEIYPKNSKNRNSQGYMSYFEVMSEIRNFIKQIMAEQVPVCATLPIRSGQKPYRGCYVQFSLELTKSVLREAHKTVTSCFHAFYPTPTLKWNHLCFLLSYIKEGKVPMASVRELSATCAALCNSCSLMDVLQHIVGVTQTSLREDNKRRIERPDNRLAKPGPSRAGSSSHSSHSKKPPPVPPRANNREQKSQDQGEPKPAYMNWHLMDVIPRLLDIVLIPLKERMTTHECSKPHEHGEIAARQRLAEYIGKFIVRVVAELAQYANDARDELDTNALKHLTTPSRFVRVNQNRAWNTGNGSPDSIAFTVDRSGIMLVGACVYGGGGSYEYTLELMQDQLRNTTEDTKSSHCWVSVESVHGTFTAADCQNDIATIKFERPVTLKAEYQYALRLCNQGGRTVNGDCGLPSVKGPDGTTFLFASSSLSFNGTTLARGQIPSLIYYGSSKLLSNTSESSDAILSALRTLTVRVGALVMERFTELLSELRSKLSPKEMRRNIPELRDSPAVNTLLPYVLTHLDTMDDPKSYVKILELIHKMLPHVAALNLLVPGEEPASLPGQYYTWVESLHPYQPSSVSNIRVLFPKSVSWIALEMDPRSITAQPEDTLTIYAAAGAPTQKCTAVKEPLISESPFRKVYKRRIQLSVEEGDQDDFNEEGDLDSNCAHHNKIYLSVTPRLANVASEYPQKAILVPGNEAIFSLETASDYLREYKTDNGLESHFGYRCLCVGYEDTPFTIQRNGLLLLEMELVYAGAACASRLLAPDLEMPSTSHKTLADIQYLATWGTTREGEPPLDYTEMTFIARGLDLASLPTIHQVLDGQKLARSASAENQFLVDFVAATENTAGGRLARWLAPMSHVDPSKCELKLLSTNAKPAQPVTVSVIIRDQYGDPVISPSLKVEILVLRLKNNGGGKRRYNVDDADEAMPEVPYQTTVRENAYKNYSFDEIRLSSGMWSDKNAAAEGNDEKTVMSEQMMINAQADGTYLATWVPQEPGNYVGSCLFDHEPINKEVVFEVSVAEVPKDDKKENTSNLSPEVDVEGLKARLRRFGINYTAGLRVRSSPSLQAEVIGCIPPDASIGFVEEVENKDGLWIRLNEESIQEYTTSPVAIAWCLQYHRQLDLVLMMESNHTSEADEEEAIDSWSDDQQGEGSAWKPEEKDSTNDASDDEERKFPFSIDLGNDALAAKKYHETQSHRLLIGSRYTCSRYPVPRQRISVPSSSDEGSSSLYVFGAEPSKRCRLARKSAAAAGAVAAGSPRRFQRKSNGNREEMMIARRHDDNVQDANVQETDIEPEPRNHSRLAQAGTQTSPDTYAEGALAQMFLGNIDGDVEDLNGDRERSRSGSRDRSKARALRGSPPPLPARASSSSSAASSPPPVPPRKHAVSLAQAKCMRSIFAALLWHEGAVHDAIACATFLKFHPYLPRAGASVVTRGAAHVTPAPRPQRHSVEVASSGHYLNLNPSTLESLTRSGNEACASRERRTEMDEAISEEEPGTSEAGGSSPAVVNVLPPALRALVSLWDALYDSDQLAVVTDKFKKGAAENQETDDPTRYSGIRKRKDRKTNPMAKAPYSVQCELCGDAKVPPPLGAHMRHRHQGCGAPCNTGYDRSGEFISQEVPPVPTMQPLCGQFAQSGMVLITAVQLWYIFCTKCRGTALRSASAQKQAKSKVVADPITRAEPKIDFIKMHNNAVFLLSIASINEEEASSSASSGEGSSRSPPTPPGSMWQPAPAFQCLVSLGAAPRPSAQEAARYYSLGRPPPPPPSPEAPEDEPSTSRGTGRSRRMHRSVSMGQAGGPLAGQCSLLARNEQPQGRDTVRDVQYLASSSSSLLGQPSANLRRLIGYGVGDDAVSAFEVPNVDPGALFRSPVLLFILARRDLKAHEEKMEAAARANAVRQYACEALNWLLRSATQSTCVHDVMWWFCETLSQYANSQQPTPGVQENQEQQDGKQAQATQSANQEFAYRESAATGAATCALCPGGRSVRGSRAALHALLGSVSALAPSLHPASAPGLQAIRCWALQYSQHDRSFLHRSQVFNVISRILSHGEDGAFDEAAFGALHESYHTYQNQDGMVWKCPDLTSWCEITVSSRPGMAGALNDCSTETFWESAEDDRNKSKWIQVTCPSGTPENRPYLVCLHIDNSRDTANKTLGVSFLFSSGSNELAYVQEIDIDPRNASWVSYSLPRLPCAPIRVRCELRGTEPSVRVRQLRVLGVPRAQYPSLVPIHALQSHVEQDTLRVFRLLTTEVFGKLLEYDSIGAESNDAAAPADNAIAGESDLREHVVGILFAGHKLTLLQKQVMTHIVFAIRFEATRAREDWEMWLLDSGSDDPTTPRPPVADNYCFEMLSLLLALSGSSVGRAHLAKRLELLSDMVSLLHTGSDRVQRQIISLLRRMITEIPPERMSFALNFGSAPDEKMSMLDWLVSYLAKAITIQVKVKGPGIASTDSFTMAGSVNIGPPGTWHMRGQTTKQHAQLVAKLLIDMAEGRVSPAWAEETSRALASYALKIAQAREIEDRVPTRCISQPTIWMALASLCVCEQSYIETFRASESEELRTAAEVRPLCANHDDGSTMAVVDCNSCGPLCAECDRFLHLNRAAKSHRRQICKEEESAIRIDIHEGCGRAKLFWLLLLVDRRTLKGLAEFRGLHSDTEGANVGAGEGTSTGTQGTAGICRFCGTRSSSGLLAIGNVCAEEQCQELANEACSRVLPCGHVCGGVRGESTCLPCLLGCAPLQDAAPLRQDADDMCMICFTDPLQAAPAIQLKCGHVFHLNCCKKVLASKWIGPRITFAFSKCPICKEDIFHWTLEELLAPIQVLYEEVRRKALMRLEYEGLAETQSQSSEDPATYAMERYAYYVCHKCGKAYFGGLARCEAESNGRWEPAELMCGACSDTTGARVCPKHGSDFLEYKCRYCCSVAVFFCFGTSHFCNACHDDFQRVTNIPRHLLPQCPAGPRGEQMPGTSDECPLHVQHPPTGEEFALGCGICRHSLAF
ncbi:PREDICTED: E3 ubiquitin-protein ligase MYCBP2 isoform X3 [Papilio xuthus]|uniref:RCR-type E3 ubiquitin transferase n=1 Tax=Papilio xuthus TaxID=66420 RepID=A0AAJ6YZG6_PAPXU|nr:PREDICTED: E3 ubiquitin-protein ligase MYCBP2 isoform X3 [Papilio xuthus]